MRFWLKDGFLHYHGAGSTRFWSWIGAWDFYDQTARPRFIKIVKQTRCTAELRDDFGRSWFLGYWPGRFEKTVHLVKEPRA